LPDGKLFLERKNTRFTPENDDHNHIDSPQFHVVEILPKGKSFNATNYIEHIQQSAFELRPESLRRRLIVHADNIRPHLAKQSQEFCQQNSLKIAPIHPILRI
jgi:hypothetical protein